MIVCAGNSETFSYATPMGVGLVQSAINMTRLCLFNPPKYILFVGSAGTYGKHNIFDIIESKVASQIELSFLLKKSYTPIDNVVSSENTNVLDGGIVNSSNYISTDYELVQKFNQLNIGLENMEFFSIMQVAQEYDIPCGGIFVVTNKCNQDAHKDFLANHKKAMDKLSQYLLKKGVINAKDNS